MGRRGVCIPRKRQEKHLLSKSPPVPEGFLGLLTFWGSVLREGQRTHCTRVTYTLVHTEWLLVMILWFVFVFRIWIPYKNVFGGGGLLGNSVG